MNDLDLLNLVANWLLGWQAARLRLLALGVDPMLIAQFDLVYTPLANAVAAKFRETNELLEAPVAA